LCNFYADLNAQNNFVAFKFFAKVGLFTNFPNVVLKPFNNDGKTPRFTDI